MTSTAVPAVVLFGLLGFKAYASDAEKPAVGISDRAADEKTIRAAANEFVKAFNAGDAKAIAAQWSDDAKYTDEMGTSFKAELQSKRNLQGSSKNSPVRLQRCLSMRFISSAPISLPKEGL
jgi:hypothetical protein